MTVVVCAACCLPPSPPSKGERRIHTHTDTDVTLNAAPSPLLFPPFLPQQAHLKEIPHLADVVSYHIDRAERIRPDGSIEHREIDGSIVVTPNFLPPGPLTIGVTSGASTPDAYLQEAIERLFLLRALKPEEEGSKAPVSA